MNVSVCCACVCVAASKEKKIRTYAEEVRDGAGRRLEQREDEVACVRER